jgi:hypothetical protein
MLIIAVLVACTPNEPIPETMLAQKDYLLYKTTEGFGPGKLMFYDPVTNVHTPILPDWNITNFSISVNDQLAFAHEGDNDIYLLDFPFWSRPSKPKRGCLRLMFIRSNDALPAN